MAGTPRDWQQALERLTATHRRRALRTVTGLQDRTVQLDGREVLNFSSNNYLGLAGHPALREALIAAVERAGVGTGASRLIVGNHDEHEALERELAAFHHRPAALLFNSGYNAGVGIIQALTTPEHVIFSDALNHACLIDGCRLSRADVMVYPHAGVARLAQLMRQHAGRPMFVVTDSVFSMDGDRAPLAELAGLCREHDAVLMVDEAHATGVLGPDGRGAAVGAGIEPHVHMGTLGKGLGTLGAYVAGSETLRELLLNSARSFVFTTAMPVGLVAATRAALRLIQGPEGDQRRARLARLIDAFGAGLRRLGLLAPGAGTTPIFPVIVRDEQQTMACCERLLARGIHAQGIRPPTVPRGTSRLRFTLMATHRQDDLDRVLSQLHELQEAGMLPRPAS